MDWMAVRRHSTSHPCDLDAPKADWEALEAESGRSLVISGMARALIIREIADVG